nr:MAG TPA: hypothetical protein [Caudoviricetes sp.]
MPFPLPYCMTRFPPAQERTVPSSTWMLLSKK